VNVDHFESKSMGMEQQTLGEEDMTLEELDHLSALNQERIRSIEEKYF